MPVKRVIDDDRKLRILESVYLGKQVSVVRPLTAQQAFRLTLPRQILLAGAERKSSAGQASDSIPEYGRQWRGRCA